MNIEYLITLLIVLVIAILIHSYFKMDLFKNEQYIFLFMMFLIIGFVWDYIGVLRGFWVYPTGNSIDILIFNLPIEELLFYLIVPYFIIVLYRVTRKNTGKPSKPWRRQKK